MIQNDAGKLSPSSFCAIGMRCGLTMRETMLLPVGMVLDLWQVYLDYNGLNKKEDDMKWLTSP